VPAADSELTKSTLIERIAWQAWRSKQNGAFFLHNPELAMGAWIKHMSELLVGLAGMLAGCGGSSCDGANPATGSADLSSEPVLAYSSRTPGTLTNNRLVPISSYIPTLTLSFQASIHLSIR
jgi:hypothetical protein